MKLGGPLVEMFNRDDDGVVMKKVITYRKKDNQLIMETATRTYTDSGDYHDTSAVQPLVDLGFTLADKVPGATGK